jgi:drug/metabolite transporter (DMT)-like permease
MPLLTFICTWLFFGSKPSRMQSIGFIFGISGVLLLVAKGQLAILLSLDFNVGDILMLTACISWSVYTALLVKKPTGVSPIVFLYVTTILGLIISTPAVLIEYKLVGGFEFNSKILYGLAYVGVFPSLFSYLLFNNGVSVLGPQVASLCLYLLPVFTAIISILFLNEPIRWFHVASQALVFIGFYLALFQKR